MKIAYHFTGHFYLIGIELFFRREMSVYEQEYASKWVLSRRLRKRRFKRFLRQNRALITQNHTS